MHLSHEQALKSMPCYYLQVVRLNGSEEVILA